MQASERRRGDGPCWRRIAAEAYAGAIPRPTRRPAPVAPRRPAADGARRALGRRGETLAAEHLRRHGCVVLARNVRVGRGEIDLIVRDGDALAFVEVKTRRIAARARAMREEQHPLLGLGPAQRARLRRLAGAWLAEQDAARPRARTIRLDAIGVVIDSHDRLRRIDHLQDAF
jgi:putative endonuclease